MKDKVAAGKQELTVYLPDTRGVTISHWGRGNLKLGMDGVYTYSRLPGAVGLGGNPPKGTCPGASSYCDFICYARRVVTCPPVWDMWARNSETETIPDELPPDAKLVRLHVSGDFTTPKYVQQWIALALRRADVYFWGYTRSWRLSDLLPDLNQLCDLPNVQLFASMDQSIMELPPKGWRRAWLADDIRAISGGGPGAEQGLDFWLGEGIHNFKAVDGRPIYLCPEETGRKANCQECNYCVKGRNGGDVVFLVH